MRACLYKLLVHGIDSFWDVDVLGEEGKVEPTLVQELHNTDMKILEESVLFSCKVHNNEILLIKSPTNPEENKVNTHSSKYSHAYILPRQ